MSMVLLVSINSQQLKLVGLRWSWRDEVFLWLRNLASVCLAFPCSVFFFCFNILVFTKVANRKWMVSLTINRCWRRGKQHGFVYVCACFYMCIYFFYACALVFIAGVCFFLVFFLLFLVRLDAAIFWVNLVLFIYKLWFLRSLRCFIMTENGWATFKHISHKAYTGFIP